MNNKNAQPKTNQIQMNKKTEIPKAKQRNGNSETNARKVLNCDARICVKGFAQLIAEPNARKCVQ